MNIPCQYIGAQFQIELHQAPLLLIGAPNLSLNVPVTCLDLCPPEPVFVPTPEDDDRWLKGYAQLLAIHSEIQPKIDALRKEAELLESF